MARQSKPEVLARFRIDKMLIQLGWQIEQEQGLDDTVRLGRDLKNPQDKEKLGQKEPDYTLYSENSDIPIAIIEAKKPHHRNMSGALQQGIEYAEILGYNNMIVFASDGNITLCKHLSGQDPTINGETVIDFLPRWQVEKLAKNPILKLGEEIKNATTLINLFEAVSNDLRGDGIEGGLDCINEFCVVLFVKIMSEKGAALPGCNWELMADARGNDLLHIYKQIIGAYREKFNDIFAEVKIQTPAILEKIVTNINNLNFSNTQLDVKGAAYEHFLSKYSVGKKSALGQHFTPRHITRLMAQLLDLKLNETIYDPFCGTGGLLVACYSLLHNQAKDKHDLKKLNGNTLYGRDITESSAKLAKMNMIILGDGHNNIGRKDSVKAGIDSKYDNIITNIPFNLKPYPIEVAEAYDSDNPDGNHLCILHCLKAAKKGGKAAIIVPESIAYQDDYIETRKIIADNCKIKAIIRLPKSLFILYTNARTFIMLLEDIGESKTEEFTVIDLKNDGFSSSVKRETTLENDIPNLLEAFEADALKEDYPKYKITPEFKFFEEITSPEFAKIEKTWALEEIIDVVEQKTKLKDGESYYEPQLNSSTNTVSPRKQARLGRNIKTDKVLTEKGDLLLATLHTQDGLFAFCDRQYIATSQIVAKVREDLISKSYLAYALKNVLPRLKKNDLVGRETYKRKEILELRIPKPTEKLAEAFRQAEKERQEVEEKLEKAIEEEKDNLAWPL